MKSQKNKKILLSAACLVAVAAAGFGGYTYYENQTMDPWLKANIAALATIEKPDQGEAGTGNTVTCYSSSRAQSGSTYYDCGSCEKQFNSRGTGGTRACTVR